MSPDNIDMSTEEIFDSWKSDWLADQQEAAAAAGLTYEQHITGRIAHQGRDK